MNMTQKCLESYFGTAKRGFSFYRGRSPKNNITKLSCEPLIEEFSNSFYTELATEFRDDKDLVNITDCLIERLKKVKVVEISLKQASLSAKKNISKRKRKKALKALDKELKEKMELAVTLCASDEDFVELFDALFDSSANETNSEDGTNEKHYCARQFLIDNNFTDTSAYRVNVNPLNINITNINCETINKAYIEEVEEKFKDEFEEDLDYRPSKKSTRCFSKAIRSNNYFAFSVKVVILGEIGISDEVKAKEKSYFLEKIKNLYEDILNC